MTGFGRDAVAKLLLLNKLELVFFVLEKQIEGSQRAIAARDVLLHFDLLSVCQSRVRVYLLFQNSQLVPNANDLVKEHFERNFLGL